MSYKATDTTNWSLDDVDWDSWQNSIAIPQRVDLNNPNQITTLDPRFLNRVTPDAKSVAITNQKFRHVEKQQQPEDTQNLQTDNDLLCTPHPFENEYQSVHNSSSNSIQFRLPEEDEENVDYQVALADEERFDEFYDEHTLEQINPEQLANLTPQPRMSLTASIKLQQQPKFHVPEIKPLSGPEGKKSINTTKSFVMPSQIAKDCQNDNLPQVKLTFKPFTQPIRNTKQSAVSTCTPIKSTTQPFVSRLCQQKQQHSLESTPRKFTNEAPASSSISVTTPHKQSQILTRINMTPIPRIQPTNGHKPTETRPVKSTTTSARIAPHRHTKLAVSISNPIINTASIPTKSTAHLPTIQSTTNNPSYKKAPQSRLNMQPIPPATSRSITRTDKLSATYKSVTKPQLSTTQSSQPMPKKQIKSKLNLTAIPTPSTRTEQPISKRSLVKSSLTSTHIPTQATTTAPRPAFKNSIFHRQSLLIKSSSKQATIKPTQSTIKQTTAPTASSTTTAPRSRIAQMMNANYTSSTQSTSPKSYNQSLTATNTRPASQQSISLVPRRLPFAPINTNQNNYKSNNMSRKPPTTTNKSTQIDTSTPRTNSTLNRISH